MRPQVYLVLIRDGHLALTVGAALEDRLLQDGHSAMALVPVARGLDFAGSDWRRQLAIRGSGPAPAGRAPHLVALYEDGLLDSLATLGLRAYVGVHHDEEARVARWADDSGAIMLPVATARDLVNAVADHTPWRKYAADVSSARYPVAGAESPPLLSRSRRSGIVGSPSPALPRKVASVATVAGPLLLGSMATTAFAVSLPGYAPAPAAAAPAGRLTAVDVADIQPAPAPPGNTGTGGFFGNLASGAGSLFNYLGNSFNNAMAQYGQAQLDQGQAEQQLGNSIDNAIGNAMAQYGQAQLDQSQAQQQFWNAVYNAGPAISQALSQAEAEAGADARQGANIGAAVGGITAAAPTAIATIPESGPLGIGATILAYNSGATGGSLIGRGLGYLYGLGDGLYNHLAFSPNGNIVYTPGTPATPGAATAGNPIVNAIETGNSYGQAVAGPTGMAARAGGLSYIAPGVQGLTYTGASLYGAAKSLYDYASNLLNSSGTTPAPGSQVMVGPDGSVTMIAPDHTVTTISPLGGVTTIPGTGAPATPAAGGAAPGDTNSGNGSPNGGATGAPAPGAPGSPTGTAGIQGLPGSPSGPAAPPSGGTGSPNGGATGAPAPGAPGSPTGTAGIQGLPGTPSGPAVAPPAGPGTPIASGSPSSPGATTQVASAAPAPTPPTQSPGGGATGGAPAPTPPTQSPGGGATSVQTASVGGVTGASASGGASA